MYFGETFKGLICMAVVYNVGFGSCVGFRVRYLLVKKSRSDGQHMINSNDQSSAGTDMTLF